MNKFKPAPKYYRLLNGILCVFKPAGHCSHKIVEKLQGNLCRDLNSLLCYNFDQGNADTKNYLGLNSLPINSDTSNIDYSNNESPLPLPISTRSPQHSSSSSSSLTLSSSPVQQTETATGVSMAAKSLQETDNTYKLVFGERYLPSDFKMSYVDGLSRHTSGVLLLGLGSHGKVGLETIGLSKYLRVYHVKGRLGSCTDNFSPKGKFIERASFRHVTQSKIDKICATTQAAFSREMYRYSGVSPDSQEAYELAASGIIRPAERFTPPIIYGIKCIDFQPPDFTLEVHAINERCQFLKKLVHDMAIQLKSRAVCTGVRRLRYGHFGVDRALVASQWNLENIIKNLEANQELLFSEMCDGIES